MVSKEKLIYEIELIAEKFGGNVKKMLRCNSAGRQSRIIEIEYDVKETK
tara:strand:- start:152 stop:298 length:147 start_codon:yes stop_codon:yes gene_type:complete